MDWLRVVLAVVVVVAVAIALLFARASAARAMFPKQRYNRIVAYGAAWVALAVAFGLFWVIVRV